ncbi:MAG: GNAT family N-acetyltransferase [Paracoccaceae bacterium]
MSDAGIDQGIDAGLLFAVSEATWPSAARRVEGPFVLRDGAGGGKRVSSALLAGPFSEAELDRVEPLLGPKPLFQVTQGQDDLDAALERRGYGIVDPSIFYIAPVENVARKPKPVSLLGVWPPLAIQRQIWADGGIGPARIAVMERAAGPRQAFVARFQNRAAGVGFVAIHKGVAMLHALHVEPAFRRQGVARYMVQGMADWAGQNGADQFSLIVTQRNSAARGLYSSLGMAEACTYHYREKTQ